MSEMTTKDLTTYLKYAAELESSVYRQERALAQAKKDCVYREPYKQHIAQPKNQANGMIRPTAPIKAKTSTLAKFLIGLAIFLCIFGTVSLIFPIDFVGGSLFIIACGAISLWAGISEKRAEDNYYSRKYQAYMEDLHAYNTRKAEAEKTYKSELASYNVAVVTAQEEYDKACVIAKRQFAYAEDAVKLLDAPLYETKRALKKLYETDIIFPKYRDMVAMCTMYEYFASGRCSQLTGSDGAYNLYEAELRQNLIINRLDTIVNSLEAIKQNQYTLYQEMRETNKTLNNISSDIRGILNNTEDIANTSRITAHCSYVTAKNTDAIKYISLING